MMIKHYSWNGATALLCAAIVATASASACGEAIDVGVHDPVMAEHDGVYYLYCTGRGLSVFTSPDMRNWERGQRVFDEAPAWTAEAFPPRGNRRRRGRNSQWAPDIAERDGVYYLYYSVSSFGRNESAVGVATNKTLNPDDPNYAWEDHGPVVQSVPGRDMFNAIDPNLAFDDEETPWLSFGSYWSGIKLVRLNDNLTEVAKPEEWYTIAARHRYWKIDERDAGDEMNSAIEAPFIFKKDGRYYLFVSWDKCCQGVNSTYKVVVGRADKITGPYLDKEGEQMRLGGGSLVVGGNEDWPGVGHCSAYTFDGTDYLVFHGYDAAAGGRSKLWIEPITWDANGWPSASLTE